MVPTNRLGTRSCKLGRFSISCRPALLCIAADPKRGRYLRQRPHLGRDHRSDGTAGRLRLRDAYQHFRYGGLPP